MPKNYHDNLLFFEIPVVISAQLRGNIECFKQNVEITIELIRKNRL